MMFHYDELPTNKLLLNGQDFLRCHCTIVGLVCSANPCIQINKDAPDLVVLLFKYILNLYFDSSQSVIINNY